MADMTPRRQKASLRTLAGVANMLRRLPAEPGGWSTSICRKMTQIQALPASLEALQS